MNPRDPAHTAATAFTRDVPCLVFTTAWVLTELADGLSRSPVGRRQFLDIVYDISTSPTVQIVPFSDVLFRAGLDLYARRPDKKWSLTDCGSFVVMDRERITGALTGDHHFEQAGFVPLLRP